MPTTFSPLTVFDGGMSITLLDNGHKTSRYTKGRGYYLEAEYLGDLPTKGETLNHAAVSNLQMRSTALSLIAMNTHCGGERHAIRVTLEDALYGNFTVTKVEDCMVTPEYAPHPADNDRRAPPVEFFGPDSPFRG